MKSGWNVRSLKNAMALSELWLRIGTGQCREAGSELVPCTPRTSTERTMHPADEFEAFNMFSTSHKLSPAKIVERFGKIAK
jgi:hypothetical protein